MGYSRKNPNMGQGFSTWNFHSRGFWRKERAYSRIQLKKKFGNSRGQLKKKLALPGVMMKVLVFGPGTGSFMGYKTIFPGLRGEALFCLEFLRSDKPKNSFFFFKKVAYVLTHPAPPLPPSPSATCWTFSGLSPFAN